MQTSGFQGNYQGQWLKAQASNHQLFRLQAQQGCAAHGRASAPESVPEGLLLDMCHGCRPVRVLLDSVEQCHLLLPGPGRLLPGRHPQPTHRSGGRRGRPRRPVLQISGTKKRYY
ncbi:uncharacterized protein [Equus caballus]|uniref:uncharacterized protein n=1 Tax=Equus caballus TaxID=9796 RepID=UPI0038B3F999